MEMKRQMTLKIDQNHWRQTIQKVTKKMFSENPRENIPGTSTRNTQGKCIFFNASADKQEFFENYLEKQLLSFPRNTFNDMSRTSLELNARGTGGLYIFFCNALPMMYLEVEKVSNLVSILVDENYDVTMFCLFYRFVWCFYISNKRI